jgi:hypothetical protein
MPLFFIRMLNPRLLISALTTAFQFHSMIADLFHTLSRQKIRFHNIGSKEKRHPIKAPPRIV